MIGIKQKIYDDIQKHLYRYNLADDQITDFLSINQHHYKERRDPALAIIRNILETHYKGEFYDYLYRLMKIEDGAKIFQSWIRDHVIHAVYTFLFGISLNNILNVGVSPFRWKLASILHDIGYPFEIAFNLQKGIQDDINVFCDQTNTRSPKVGVEINFRNLYKLNNRGLKSFSLIDGRLEEWGIEIKSNNIFRRLLREKGRFDHGIISALIGLKVLYILYDTHRGWDRTDFDEDIVDACTAIFLHNLKSEDLDGQKIHFQRAPLAYLLKLADTLQDWERPKTGRPAGLSAKYYSYEIIDEVIRFCFLNLRCSESVLQNLRQNRQGIIGDLEILQGPRIDFPEL